MSEEERFVKSYPQFCCNGKPLSPFWDLWQDGAEFGYNKAREEAKEILKYVLNSFVGDLPKEKCFFDEEELKAIAEVEQFLSDIKE